MDSLIAAAARALATGDPLGALKRVALRDDAPALALRGIAMAQLGDFSTANKLLRSAIKAFGSKETVSRARCIVAKAEIALAQRDLGVTTKALDIACATLESHGDHGNAMHARLLCVRRFLLLGRLDEAERMLSQIDRILLVAASRIVYDLAVAGIAIRRMRIKLAGATLAGAEQLAREVNIPALTAEVENALRVMHEPAAQLRSNNGESRLLLLEDIETLYASPVLIVDACRHVIRHSNISVSLATRPILFALVRALATAWPGDVPRNTLITCAFRAKHIDESHRVRLRVEIARLRVELRTVATVIATQQGFTLAPRDAQDVVILTPLVESKHADVLALLADGESWSTSALSLAAGASPRTIQRALDALAAAGKALPIGRGRTRRWMTPPMLRIPTILLLPGSLPIA